MMKHTSSASRLALPDILKGVAVIRMIIVHLMEVFASPEIYQSQAGKLLVFLAGPPGAPLFMVIMGYFIAASGKEMQDGVYRGLKLIVWGLLLNLGLNFHLLLKIAFGIVQANPWPYVFGVDILFLAGFSLIFLSVCKNLFRHQALAYVILFMVFTILTPLLPKYEGGSDVARYLFAFIWSAETWSYFPIFPWMAYPAAGFAFYLFNRRYGFSGFSAKGLIYIASLLLLVLAITFEWGFNIVADTGQYYHHALLFAVWILMMIAFWVIIIHLITRKFTKTIVIRYFQWTGHHVTNFYVFQWLLIGNIGTVLFKTQHAWALTGWFLFVAAASGLLVSGWVALKNKMKPERR